jgi:hypothetical protein
MTQMIFEVEDAEIGPVKRPNAVVTVTTDKHGCCVKFSGSEDSIVFDLSCGVMRIMRFDGDDNHKNIGVIVTDLPGILIQHGIETAKSS